MPNAMNSSLFSLAVLTLLAFDSILAQPSITLRNVASGFRQPVGVVNAGDARLFVVEKSGVIRIIDANGQVAPTAFLNIEGRVNSSAGERGLLGLAFHPDYAANGYFYVNYTGLDGHTRIARFSVRPGNPNSADPASEKILLQIAQPFNNHNAGDMAFGPDGYLYFGMGDGGSGGDPGNRSQNGQTLLGKMIRIDVDMGDPYGIPEDNPFVKDERILDEIWAFGLRNPWRISFDRATGDLWIADVGQNAWEEVNRQPANSKGGENYGWRCYEGFAPFNTSGCRPASEYTPPVFVYPHVGSGCSGSVTGGYVYRGEEYPNLRGQYLYGDYCTGKIWALSLDGKGGWTNREMLSFSPFEIAAFGEGHDGELYLATLRAGVIYRIADGCAALAPPVISFENDILSVPAIYAGYQWLRDGQLIEGATQPDYAPTAEGSYQVRVTDQQGCIATSEAFLATSVAEAVGVRWWSVSPNPFHDVLRLDIELTQPAVFNVKLFDAGGRLVWQDRLEKARKWSRRYTFKDLKPGLYFLSLERGSQRIVHKLIKSNL
jgi:glucose/arabinose dehydrogenase